MKKATEMKTQNFKYQLLKHNKRDYSVVIVINQWVVSMDL